MTGGAPDAAGAIDRRRLRTLLRLYLRVTLRGRSVQRMAGRKGSQRKALVVLTIVNLLVGAIMAAGVATHPDVFTFAFLVQSVTFFSVGVSVLAEAGDMLFNRSEADVLGPRPVGERTLLAAKAINAFAFAAWLSLTLNAIPAFAGLHCVDAKPWFPVVHLFASLLTAALCAAFTVAAYEILTRVSGRDRFDDVVAWAQVGMTVFFALGYQLVPRLLQRAGGLTIPLDRWWLVLVPSGWVAGFQASIAGHARGVMPMTLGLLAVAMTLVSAWAAVGRLARGHAEALARLAEMPARAPRAPGARPGDGIARWSRRVPLRWWLRDPAERASFHLVAAYCLRDRELRTRLYPQLAMLILLPMMAWFSKSTREGTFLAAACLALVAIFPLTVLDIIRQSPQHAASDVLRSSPLAGPGRLFLGARKAAIALFVPTSLAVLLPVLALSLQDWREIVPLALSALLVVPAITLLPGVLGSCVPLAHPVIRGEQSVRRMLYPFIGMVVIGVLLFVAWLSHGSAWSWVLLAAEAAGALVAVRLLHARVLAGRWEME